MIFTWWLQALTACPVFRCFTQRIWQTGRSSIMVTTAFLLKSTKSLPMEKVPGRLRSVIITIPIMYISVSRTRDCLWPALPILQVSGNYTMLWILNCGKIRARSEMTMAMLTWCAANCARMNCIYTK